MNHKILVTGASGFIGRALLPILQDKGFSVRATCRTETSLEGRAAADHIEWIGFDLVDAETDYGRLLNGVDAVVHLAGRAHVTTGHGDATNDCRTVNIDGTEKLARAAAKEGVDRFLFLSSVKVYGEGGELYKNNKIQRLTENDAPSAQDIYAKGKLEAEDAIYNVCRAGTMHYVILRPPLVFGPHVRANFLQLLHVVHRGYPLPFASVNNLRSFIYVGNLCHAILACLVKPEAADQLFLVSDSEISTPDLIRKIAYCMDRKARLFPMPLPLLKMLGKMTGRSNQIARLTGSLVDDSTKIRQHLQWQPPYSFDEGLKATIDWYKARRV